MEQTQKRTSPEAETPGSGEQKQKRVRLNANTKIESVLRTLVERGERGLNCFEAVAICRDFVLRSTISELAHIHGLTFIRTAERVPGHRESVVDCVRYALDQAGLRKALELLPEVQS